MSQDILITPGSGEPQILFRGSGTTDTAIELNVLSSYQSATGSGTAILFEGTEGQLFGITDNLSSGTIFSVGDIAGLPLIEADASGDVQLIEYGRYVGVGTGTPAYQFDVFGTGRFSDYLIVNGNITGAATGIFDGGVTYPDGLTQKNAWPSEVVSSKVKKIVADHLGIDEAKVTEESSFIDDLGADSLDTVELVMAFEEEFGSEISDSEAEKILTVGDAVKFIEGKAN